MPLKATLNGREVISVLCSDEDWAAVRAASRNGSYGLRTACCFAPAYASHSPLGLRFFAHKVRPEDCSWAGESDAHQHLKAAAAEAVRARAGWQADVEVCGEGWRA